MEPGYVKIKDIKPVLAGYIREAQALSRMVPFPDDAAIHDIRVLMKKSRAVMKLVARQTDPDSYTRNYMVFRETGRLLSNWRETSVHRKTLKSIKKNHEALFESLTENEKIGVLLKKPLLPSAPVPEALNDLTRIGEMLNKAGFRIRFQKMDNLDPKLLLNELENSFDIAADRYIICRNKPKPENLHQFRKKAKDFLYQLWFFRSLNPAVIKSLEKRLDLMTQNLGRSNDLSQLVKALEYKYDKTMADPAIDELIILIREAQDRYLSKVWPVAHKVFCPGNKLLKVIGFKILII